MSTLDKLNLARKDLAVVLDRIEAAKVRLHDELRGQPGSGFGGNGGRGSSSPVESALGLNGVGGGRITEDQAARKLAAINELTKKVCTDLHLLSVLVSGAVPRSPTGKDQAEATNINMRPMCDHCMKWRDTGIIKVMKDRLEVHRTGDVVGNLDQRAGLCRWCYDFVRGKGRLPEPSEVRGHGDRVMKDARVPAS